jgi:hypothetical protein
VTQNRPAARDAEKFGQVLQFRPRSNLRPNLARMRNVTPLAEQPEHEVDDDFACFEEERDEPIDYRQRMLMNVIAIAIVTLLVTAGVWIADTIAVMQKTEDCALQGRGNCAPIEASVRP